jgi:hypothetical protein
MPDTASKTEVPLAAPARSTETETLDLLNTTFNFLIIIVGLVLAHLVYRMKYHTKMAELDAKKREEERIERERIVEEKQDERAIVTAKKVDEVRIDLQESVQKVNKIDQTTTKTMHLVNGAMTVQLRLTSVALRRTAEVTGHPEDIKAAEIAEQDYRDHVELQKDADRGDEVSPRSEDE